MNEMVDFVKTVHSSSKEAEQAAETIAKTFFRTLRKGGFSEKQIIHVGTTIISCLVDQMREYKDSVQQKIDNKAGVAWGADEEKPL